MLPKPYRLSSLDIRQTLRSGKRIRNDSMHIVFQKRPMPNPQFAVIVPKSVDKRATKRNRIKRLIHESLYKMRSDIPPEVCMVLLVKKNISTMKQVDVEHMIRSLVRVQ